MDRTSERPRSGRGPALFDDLTAPAVTAAGSQRWHQVFAGDTRELSTLRRWLCAVLPDCASRDDVMSVVTELAGNAILHSESGNGGWFAVEVTLYRSVVAVAVADCGGPEEPHVVDDSKDEHGRGLLLVRGLSIRTGFSGDHRGRLVWAHIAWDHKGDMAPAPSVAPVPSVAPAPSVPPAPSLFPGRPAAHEGSSALGRRFPGVPAWYGRSTLLAWSLANPDFTVSGLALPELAEPERRRTTPRMARLRGGRR